MSIALKFGKTLLISAVFLNPIIMSVQHAAAQLRSDESGGASRSSDANLERRLKWFRDARFGMFIHWGLYAVPAGEWKGKPIAGLGEWIMNRAKIPREEYELLAQRFDPVKFDAKEVVRLAKNAGMKYIVITAKHHDGFAMYHSKVSKYNIYDATPFKRDPMKELADEANKAGLKMCFYYSQTQDWYEPDAVGNDWDFPADGKRDFQKYLDEKVKPQVTELLTNYGPIGLIWFDTPRNITKEQSRQLVDLVHRIQPDTLVSGRVGHGLGDYDSAGDNQISMGNARRIWETPVTMNDTWGFKRDDIKWKSSSIIIRQMVQVISQGGNYLLNVGPTAEGIIPQPSVDLLTQAGAWLKVNNDSVYGAGPSPFPYELSWGIITTKPGKLYLHVFNWPKDGLVLYGIKNKVNRAYLLANRSKLKFKQHHDSINDHHELRINLPATAPDESDSVIVVETDGAIQADTGLMQQPSDWVTLPAFLSKVHKGEKSVLKFDTRGVAEGWFDRGDWLEWDFKVSKPGEFDVVAITSEQKYGRGWEGGHAVSVDVAGQVVKGAIDDQGKEIDPANPYWPYVLSKLGRVKLDKAGRFNLSLKADSIKSEKKLGLTLVSVRLVPVGR